MTPSAPPSEEPSAMAPDAAAALLAWYVAMGADEAIGEVPVDRLRPPTPAASPAAGPRAPAASSAPALRRAPAPATPAPIAPPQGPETGEGSAQALAAAATTLAELERAVDGFTGCPLRLGASRTVFIDGNPEAPLLVIGEAPGADEDRVGKPFVGRSGQLLDRMLQAIGRDRGNTCITNVIYWRPPVNRKPALAEVMTCLPFVLRTIALVRPRVVMLAGGTPTGAVLGLAEGIMRLRGRWFDLELPGLSERIPTLPTFHPSFLLRSPERKREAWMDLLALAERLKASG